MNKILGSMWLVICAMYVFDMLELVRFHVIMMSLLLAFYSFTDKK